MAAAAAANLAGRPGVRVVVIGDAGTGKSSLVVAVATEQFPENVPKVMPHTRLPADYFPDRVPITIIDTSSSPEQKPKLIAECQAADAVVLTYACDRLSTLERLSTYWLPELRRIQLKAPVIVVGCKLDLRDDQQNSLEQTMAPIMQSFREIETCIECSALRQIQVPEVFYYAQKAVLHPTAPLFDQEAQSLKPRCVRALKRIFILCDHDRDGALSDVELNDFQVRCFSAPLQPTEISGVKRVVQEKMPEGVNDSGLTLTGFLFLHALFIEKGRLETTWTVLRKFGYDNEIKLRDDFIPTSIKRAPDQTLELTNEVVDYLKGIFHMFDIDNDGALLPSELDDLFSTAPENPWTSDLYKDCADRNVLGGLSLEGFLSKWALMTLLDPANSFANLVYVGYLGDFSSTFTITRKIRVDHKKQQTQRNVFQCYVFGPKGAGKTALLQSFLGRQPSDALPTNSDRFAANTVELSDGTRKTLVLREIPEGDVRSLLNNKDSLARCDAAVFVYDSCDEFSWQRARDLLVQVATHGENTGYEVPCLIVAAKDDLDQSPVALQESTRVSQVMGIKTPIPISVKLKDLNNIFCRVVLAAQRPHLSIPETEAATRTRNMDHARVPPRPLRLHFLEEITDNFSEERKLGVGTFGSVYEGQCKDGEKMAVKKLHDHMVRLNDKLFEKEYHNLANLEHPNIVRLVGYCIEIRKEYEEFDGRLFLTDIQHMALCFEFMCKGSLASYLEDESTGLDWHTRYAIIKGICKGLKYLHEELDPPMYHLDLKPDNILLNEQMTPKIADFGLSKLFGDDKTRVSASPIGTIGYLPPEYIKQNLVSNKLDIFSLGVIIIKLMMGPVGYYQTADISPEDFIELTVGRWRKRLQRTSNDAIESYDEQVKTCIKIALSCVEDDRCKRPTIGDIVSELDYIETTTQFSNALTIRGSAAMEEETRPCMSTKNVSHPQP